MVYYTAIPK
jgi:hypothetical protein